MSRRVLWLVLFALGVAATQGQAIPVRIPGILITDETYDPFDYGDSRGAIGGFRYLDDVPSLTIASAPAGLVQPVVAVLRPDRRLYVLDRGSDPLGLGRSTGGVYLVDPSLRPADAVGELVFSSPLFRRPADLLLEPDGRILVLDADADPLDRGGSFGALFRGDPISHNFELVSADARFQQPSSLTYDRDGTLLVLDRTANPLGLSDTTPGALFRVDPATGATTLVKAFDPLQLPDPRAVAVLANGDYLVADSMADPGGGADGLGAIYRIARSSGVVTPFIDDPIFRDPIDIVLGEENQVWVLDRTADPDGSTATVGALFRFDATTGTRTLLQTYPFFQGVTAISFAGGPSIDGSRVRWTDETGGALEPGNLVTVRASLRSVGTEDPGSLVFADTLRPEWNFVAGSESLGAGTFSFDPADLTLRWDTELPRGTSQVLRYRLRASGDLVDGDTVRDSIRVWVGEVPTDFAFGSPVSEPFAPGDLVFLDQRVDGGENIGLLRALAPGSLTPQTIHIGAPLVQPVDAVFLEDRVLAILDLAAAPQQGTGAQAVLLYDRAQSRFRNLWTREQGDGIVAPVGVARDRNGDILLVDRNANPLGLPYEPDFSIGDFGPGAVYRIDRATGALSLVFSDARMREPFSCDVAPDGTVVVVDYVGVDGIGDLWEYHPESGQVVRRFLRETWFRDPLGLALDPATGDAYVADLTHYNDENESPVVNNGTLFRVGRGTTTTYAILSQSARLVDPVDCFVAEDGRIYVTDREANPLQLDVADPGAVFAIDKITGQISTVAADFGVRRPSGPAGLGEARIVVGDLTFLDLDGAPVVAGDTLAFSIEVHNETRQGVPEVLAELAFSGPLVLEEANATLGEVLVASSENLFSWVGEVGSEDTLAISGLVSVRDGFGYGTPVSARATVRGRAQEEVREVESKLAASFETGIILVLDEAADPEGLGGQPGALFSLARDDRSVAALHTGAPVQDPSSLLLREDGTLLISDRRGGNPGDVWELDPGAGTITSIFADSSVLLTPIDLVAAPDGALLIVDRDVDPDGNGPIQGTIFRVPAGADAPEVFSADPAYRFLSEAAFLPDGRLFVADRRADPEGVGGNTAAIFQLDVETGEVLESWQFEDMVEPGGLVAYQDTLLLVTDLSANPHGFQRPPGAIFVFDPDDGSFAEFLVNSLTVRPYRSFPQPDGTVLVVDQAAVSTGGSGAGLVWEYQPVTRALRPYVGSGSFLLLSEIAPLPASFLTFASYSVTDLDGAPLRASDRVAARAVLANAGEIAGQAEFEDILPDGVVPVPGSLSATSGTITAVGSRIHWTGSIPPAGTVEITYEGQLDPLRVRDEVLVFRPVAQGEVVGRLERVARLTVFVELEPGHFYVLDADADPLGTGIAPGAVLKITQRSGTTANWFSDPNWRIPVSVAVLGEEDARAYVLDQGARVPGTRRGAIYEIDGADLTTRVAAVDSTWFRTETIVAASDAELLLVDSWADPLEFDPTTVGPGAVYLVNPVSGANVVVASDTSWVRPVDLAQTRAGRWLLLDADADPLETGQPRGAIFSIDLITGETTFFAASAEWEEPVALAVAPDSTIYVVDQLATPEGGGTGSVWALRDEPGTSPELFAVSDAFVRPQDLVTQINGDLILVDSEASPGLQEEGRGALFFSQGEGFVPLAATTAMQEPRALFIYGDVTPIIDIGLEPRLAEDGISLHWRGLSGRSDTRYLVYRRVLTHPDELESEPDLSTFTLLPSPEIQQGGGEHVFLDREIAPETWYAYIVAIVSPDGPVDTSPPAVIRSGPSRLVFGLAPSAPNPFAAVTTLRFTIPRTGRVDLDLFDVGGRRVRRLVDGNLEAGVHEVAWDGRTDRGHDLASGVYFARLSWEGEVRTERLVRLR